MLQIQVRAQRRRRTHFIPRKRWLKARARVEVEVGRDEAWQGGRPTGKTVLSIGLIIKHMHSYMLNSTISTSATGVF